MTEDTAILIVQRVGGIFPGRPQPSLTVIVDGATAGQVGDEVFIQPGHRSVTVRAGYFTCCPRQIQVLAGEEIRLAYHATWLAWASIALSLLLFIALLFPAVMILNFVERFRDNLFVTLLMIAVLLLWSWVAFVAPLRLLAAAGIYSHLLERSNSDT